MLHEIIGSVMPMVEIHLDPGETVFAQTGAMQWMTSDIEMTTNMRGGVLGALRRKVSGGDMFLAHFSSRTPGGKVAFGHSFPGRILPIDVGKTPVVCQKRAFLCATEGVDYEIEIQKKLGTGFFGGEGFIMQRFTGSGTVFVEMDGEYVLRELEAGEKIRMETGALGMCDLGMDISIERVKGIRNMLMGGEGLFLTTIEGPGRVWIQTMPAQSLAAEITGFLPLNTSG